MYVSLKKLHFHVGRAILAAVLIRLLLAFSTIFAIWKTGHKYSLHHWI